MLITVVCSHCRYHDNDPNLEINCREGKIYYLCPSCKKESIVSLKAETVPLPKSKRL